MASDRTRGILSHWKALLNAAFLEFGEYRYGPSRPGAALVALNYECNIAVKRFSAHQTSPLSIGEGKG
jgi:hypothetical protein